MRRILPIIGLFVLAGCNIVVSREPMFTLADEAGAPALRPGWWDWGASNNCAIDDTLPVEAWPNCATPVIVADHALIAADPDGPQSNERIGYVLAAGDPLILQLTGCIPREDGAQDTARARDMHCYFGVRPIALDAQGMIVRFSQWPVLCGPFPKDNPAWSGVTHRPYPGLRIVDDLCEAADVAAVKAAAWSSEAEMPNNLPDLTPARWIREAPPQP